MYIADVLSIDDVKTKSKKTINRELALLEQEMIIRAQRIRCQHKKLKLVRTGVLEPHSWEYYSVLRCKLCDQEFKEYTD